jgi:hypothetical protein
MVDNRTLTIVNATGNVEIPCLPLLFRFYAFAIQRIDAPTTTAPRWEENKWTFIFQQVSNRQLLLCDAW